MSALELNYKILGEGKPVVIFHGLFGMLDNWMTFARKLQDKYMVILVDLRNHGKSPHSDIHSYESMAEDVNHLMDTLNIKSAPVIGHSMGGKTAMTLAQNYPNRVSHLISVDMGIDENEGGHEKYFNAMDKLNVQKITRRSEAEDRLKELISSQSIRLFLLKNLDRTANGDYRWKFNLKSLKDNYQEILKGIPKDKIYDGPTLFIGGANSDYISEEDLSDFKAIFPQAKIVMIDDAGHWIHVEQRVKLLEVIQDFIDAN